MDSVIVVAIITLISNVLINILQYRNVIAQAKEKESTAVSNLIERAVAINQEEVRSLRAINADLLNELKQKQDKIELLEKRITALEEEIRQLKKF